MQVDAPFVIVENVTPQLDCGRYPVKAIVGREFTVSADIFKEGHDVIAAVLKYRVADDDSWCETPMRYVDNDRWSAFFRPDRVTRYAYTVEAWPDTFRSWRSDFVKRVAAKQDLTSDIEEGRRLLGLVAERVAAVDRPSFTRLLATYDDASDVEQCVRVVLDDGLLELVERYPDRTHSTLFRPTLEVIVDRREAEYAAWYEFFPRSQGSVPGRSATFDDCIRRLPEIRDMGFDVVYLPPIHPIGRTKRKGPNNSVISGPKDPGCPYAIGGPEGGHKAVEPGLGTLEDFDRFVSAATSHGMEVALDIAIQCSPDHPYVTEHPEWFYHRPDGTIKFAENPPKKYEDIFPVNFYTEDRAGLWNEMKSIFLFWIDHGVKTFRVDNPHTKPISFWEWLIAEIKRDHPDAVFLSEAFTRPKVLKSLAKAGFTQSYTYFTWRNFKNELEEYLTELTQTEVSEYLRGNLFANTPDILPFFLQEGGRPAFKIRFALAATLSSVYGIYSGFELCENRAVPGKEEYLNSEKYDYKVWDWDRPGNIKDFISTVNRVRHENPALQLYQNLRFFPSDDDNIIFYGKATADHDNIVLVAVNLDPFQPHETTIHVPLREFGIGPEEKYLVHEMIGDTKYLWQGESQHIRLDPAIEPAAIYVINRWQYQNFADPCY
jgi:starch synthase (maltosyl-transferring)